MQSPTVCRIFSFNKKKKRKKKWFYIKFFQNFSLFFFCLIKDYFKAAVNKEKNFINLKTIKKKNKINRFVFFFFSTKQPIEREKKNILSIVFKELIFYKVQKKKKNNIEHHFVQKIRHC